MLSKDKVWGGLFALLPRCSYPVYKYTSTGQVISEVPLGIMTAVYFLVCMFVVWKKGPNK